MTYSRLFARSGGLCEFCGIANDLKVVPVPPDAEVLLCAQCREDTPAAEAHWRCLEGAAWSGEPDVQLAVWRKLATIDASWAIEARAGMAEPDKAAAGPSAVEHRDCNGVLLSQGDTVVLTKDLTVKGAGFTAKRGTSVRGITLVASNAGQIEGRVEGQRIVILTEFVKRH